MRTVTQWASNRTIFSFTEKHEKSENMKTIYMMKTVSLKGAYLGALVTEPRRRKRYSYLPLIALPGAALVYVYAVNCGMDMCV